MCKTARNTGFWKKDGSLRKGDHRDRKQKLQELISCSKTEQPEQTTKGEQTAVEAECLALLACC
jgi:hypothetical protein